MSVRCVAYPHLLLPLAEGQHGGHRAVHAGGRGRLQATGAVGCSVEGGQTTGLEAAEIVQGIVVPVLLAQICDAPDAHQCNRCWHCAEKNEVLYYSRREYSASGQVRAPSVLNA